MFGAENRDLSHLELEHTFRLTAEAIAQLAAQERGVLVRLYLQKISIKDVAAELGLSTADVINLAAKALSEISSRLEGLVDLQTFNPQSDHCRATLRKVGFNPSRIGELALEKIRSPSWNA